jgi:hypothetical protein
LTDDIDSLVTTGLLRRSVRLTSATKSAGDDKRGFHGFPQKVEIGSDGLIFHKPGNAFP